MHPPVHKTLLRTKPQKDDFILGKQGNKYVCWDTKQDGHILIIGGSGSGKTTLVNAITGLSRNIFLTPLPQQEYV